MNCQIETYSGSKFCTQLREVTERRVFFVVPNWKCDVNYRQCNKLVCSLMYRLNDTNSGLLDSKEEMNNVWCEEDIFYDGSVVQVSAVFRALCPSEVAFQHRTNLDLNAISAEGIWNSSSGQLCMVGCFDGADRDSVSCDCRICLYMAASLSSTQRSVISGSISKLNLSSDLNFPLSIEMPVKSWAPYSHKYSKIELARAFYKRSKVFENENENEMVGIHRLGEDLDLYACLIVDQPPKIKCQNPFICLEILSVGPLVGRIWQVPAGFGNKFSSRLRPDLSRLLNVSAELSLEI